MQKWEVLLLSAVDGCADEGAVVKIAIRFRLVDFHFTLLPYRLLVSSVPLLPAILPRAMDGDLASP